MECFRPNRPAQLLIPNTNETHDISHGTRCLVSRWNLAKARHPSKTHLGYSASFKPSSFAMPDIYLLPSSFLNIVRCESSAITHDTASTDHHAAHHIPNQRPKYHSRPISMSNPSKAGPKLHPWVSRKKGTRIDELALVWLTTSLWLLFASKSVLAMRNKSVFILSGPLTSHPQIASVCTKT